MPEIGVIMDCFEIKITALAYRIRYIRAIVTA